MYAEVSKGLCIACELCPDICPEVFEMQEDGLAGMIVTEIPDDYEEAVQEAADNCPSEAIRVD
ncbi:MAG: ferredoxin [Peptococcaceae bacterium]|nr:ferredoxin [Peptococcaceae bacterium]